MGDSAENRGGVGGGEGVPIMVVDHSIFCRCDVLTYVHFGLEVTGLFARNPVRHMIDRGLFFS